jgi:HIRAN domain
LAARHRREAEKTERERKKEQETQEKRKNKPIHFADFMVAGAKRKEYSENIELYADEGDEAFFERDYGNDHDDNATWVTTKHGFEMGYVPRGEARTIAKLLDSKHKYRSTIKKS